MKELFKKYFTDFDDKAFLVLKLQIILIAILLNGFADYFFQGSLILTQILFSLIYLVLLFFALKNELKEEKIQAIVFFIGLLVSVQITFLINFSSDLFFKSNFIVAWIIVFILFIFFYYFLFRKNFVYGKVLVSDKNTTVIQTSFDFGSFLPAGKYIVASNKKFKLGEKVKVALNQSIFSRKPEKVIE